MPKVKHLQKFLAENLIKIVNEKYIDNTGNNVFLDIFNSGVILDLNKLKKSAFNELVSILEEKLNCTLSIPTKVSRKRQ